MVSPAKAFYFGPPGRVAFGWLHLPENGKVGSTGILICNSLGYDALCLHRTQRRLASSATFRGLPVLRFDYDGTGDSVGSDLDPGRLAAWVESIRQAAFTLQRHTGVTQVVAFGVRMGATLALLAAQDTPAITGLIAVNPVVDGRRYLRELRAMAATSSQVPDESHDPLDIQDFSGLVMTRTTRDAVSTLKLSTGRLDRAPDRVLLVERVDLPTEESLPQRLSSLGSDVRRRPFPGYGDMLRSAHEAIVPEADIEQWLDWIPPTQASRSIPPAIAAEESCRFHWPDSASGVYLEERAFVLDDCDKTFGVLTLPAAPAPNPKRALLLLNSGAIHHIGPHRIYVRTARECASRGAAVFRMDLPGLGDSPVLPGRPENATYPDNPADMIRPVVDFLRHELGIREVDCAGICSGGYHALKVASAGVELREITVINPLTFFWKPHLPLSPPEFQDVANMQRYRRKGLSLRDWIRLLKGEVHIGRIAGTLVRRWTKKAIFLQREIWRLLGLPLQEDLAAELRRIAESGTRKHFIFADRDPGGQMLKDEGGWTVGRLERRGLLDVETIANADHTFTSWKNQQIVIDRLVRITTGAQPRQ